jgi:hypothetical protein
LPTSTNIITKLNPTPDPVQGFLAMTPLAETTNNIVLEQLRVIRASLGELTAKIDRIDERLAFVETRMGHIKVSEGHANAVLGQVNLRLLQMEQHGKAVNDRLGRIEQQLANGRVV